MTDARRLQKDMRALVGKDTPPKTLSPRDAAAPLAAAVGSARPRQTGSGGGGGGGTAGIASPLTEPDAGDRAYHAERTHQSSDGFFVLKVRPLSQITFTDAAGREVVMNLDNPA